MSDAQGRGTPNPWDGVNLSQGFGVPHPWASPPMMTNAETLALGAHHQDAGDLGQAEALYRRVVDADAHDLNARYRLAVVCQMQGRTAEAIILYRQLLEVKPD